MFKDFGAEGTVGTKSKADPETCFQELISENLLLLLRGRPCLELIIVSSNIQALLFLQDKLLESVWKAMNSSKKSYKLLDPFQNLFLDGDNSVLEIGF